MVEWYEQRFGEEMVYVVPTRVALQRAWNAGVSIFEYGESAEDVEAAFEGLPGHVEWTAKFG